ncbi:hypothetical protein [Salinigranum marinum]|uniref:hypothetical protein n=1 Tax=Salinigranum marinum TaxID=1515595 RepID=UPI002989CFE7|nr:hypothetical protein [Salinigranum marinum]
MPAATVRGHEPGYGPSGIKPADRGGTALRAQVAVAVGLYREVRHLDGMAGPVDGGEVPSISTFALAAAVGTAH